MGADAQSGDVAGGVDRVGELARRAGHAQERFGHAAFAGMEVGIREVLAPGGRLVGIEVSLNGNRPLLRAFAEADAVVPFVQDRQRPLRVLDVVASPSPHPSPCPAP